MDKAGFRSVANSPPFGFVVGSTKDVFYVHRHLLSPHSETLYRLATGKMLEASNGLAELTDIDSDTFARVLEFMYVGDYTVPKPDIVLVVGDLNAENKEINASSNTPSTDAKLAEACTLSQPEEMEEEDDASFGGLRKWSKKEKMNKKKAKNWSWCEADVQESKQVDEVTYGSAFYGAEGPTGMYHRTGGFCNEAEGISRGHRQCRKDRLWKTFNDKTEVKQNPAWEPPENNDRREDYTQVLLCHAHLYAFSDRYTIDTLAELALQKLRLTLSRFTLHDERVTDIVQLIRFTYAQTVTYDNGLDKLRSLVLEYSVCHVEKLIKLKDFEVLLEEEGTLASDLVKHLIPRLD